MTAAKPATQNTPNSSGSMPLGFSFDVPMGKPITDDGWPAETTEPHASEEQRDQHRADTRPCGKFDEKMREVLSAGIPENLPCSGGIHMSQERVEIVLLLFLQSSQADQRPHHEEKRTNKGRENSPPPRLSVVKVDGFAFLQKQQRCCYSRSSTIATPIPPAAQTVTRPYCCPVR
jgi:hypothetical protein